MPVDDEPDEEDEDEELDPLTCWPTVRLTDATVPSMVEVRVASASAVWALVTWVWVEAMLASSEAIWAAEAPSLLVGGQVGLVVGQGGLGLGQGGGQGGAVDGGQRLAGGHRLARRHVHRGDPARDAEVQVGLAGRLEGARGGHGLR